MTVKLFVVLQTNCDNHAAANVGASPSPAATPEFCANLKCRMLHFQFYDRSASAYAFTKDNVFTSFICSSSIAGLIGYPYPRPATASQACEPASPLGLQLLPHPVSNVSFRIRLHKTQRVHQLHLLFFDSRADRVSLPSPGDGEPGVRARLASRPPAVATSCVKVLRLLVNRPVQNKAY
jgi:hypothetical protein